ncbi:GNAT family N-acetyltransferase [Streptomyces sp. NPDC005438]|uniref:GNAT family N-acetyltransferase n=1 Tax=Streptomyces sp. NPDC005438 TaxID=3156880 RepID=UPI0033BB1348
MTATQPPTVRPASSADAAQLAHVHRISRAVTMPYLPPQVRDHQEVTRWFEEVVLPTSRVWVAVRGDQVLGYAALKGDVLEQLYLRPEVRRRGIGTLLLDEVRRHSPGGLSLRVFQWNTDARAFYAHHGFRLLATSDGHGPEGNMERLPDATLRWPGRAGAA